MKAEELRIGNWLLGAAGEAQRVAYITETIGLHNNIGGTDKYQENPIFSYDINDLKPIPLSPEILERYGFELYTSTTIKDKPFIIFRKRTFRAKFIDGEFAGLSCNSGATDVKHLKYLHQLQNLFYSVYGYELTPSQELQIKK